MNQFEALSLGLGLPFEFMKLTLTFDGNLHAVSRSNNRTKEKWEIRNQIHPQLAELWMSHPVLNRIQKVAWLPKSGVGITPPSQTRIKYDYDTPAQPQGDHVINLCEPFSVGGKLFQPLVRKSLDLACGIRILFLRKEEPGSIIHNMGDVDNRIKTLFDGLRMPKKGDPTIDGGPCADPLYCLLEDDSLITDCDIRTDRLLSRPNSGGSEVRLIIEIVINVMRVQPYNLPILSD
jgi:hypothetical protein